MTWNAPESLRTWPNFSGGTAVANRLPSGATSRVKYSPPIWSSLLSGNVSGSPGVLTVNFPSPSRSMSNRSPPPGVVLRSLNTPLALLSTRATL
jgi:hypothetical protein